MVTQNRENSQNPVMQIVDTTYDSYTRFQSVIPVDNTIPQITEGDELFTLTITPTSATSILEFNVEIHGFTTPKEVMSTIALFQDDTDDALAANCWNGSYNSGTGSRYSGFFFKHVMVSGTTSATTFKIRIGTSNTAYSWYVNGSSAARLYGGIMHSTMTITEYKA